MDIHSYERIVYEKNKRITELETALTPFANISRLMKIEGWHVMTNHEVSSHHLLRAQQVLKK